LLKKEMHNKVAIHARGLKVLISKVFNFGQAILLR